MRVQQLQTHAIPTNLHHNVQWSQQTAEELCEVLYGSQDQWQKWAFVVIMINIHFVIIEF